MSKGQFKKGQRSVRWKGITIGSTRLMDGYLQKKVTETGYPPRDWVGVHILLWQEAHGPLPAGHCLRFKDGNRQHISLDNLELLSRQKNMARNTIHRYPPELKQAIRAAAQLRRTIRRKSDAEEQAEGPAESSFRNHRESEGRREAYGD